MIYDTCEQCGNKFVRPEYLRQDTPLHLILCANCLGGPSWIDTFHNDMYTKVIGEFDQDVSFSGEKMTVTVGRSTHFGQKSQQ
jgi:hypothetical protein